MKCQHDWWSTGAGLRYKPELFVRYFYSGCVYLSNLALFLPDRVVIHFLSFCHKARVSCYFPGKSIREQEQSVMIC